MVMTFSNDSAFLTFYRILASAIYIAILQKQIGATLASSASGTPASICHGISVICVLDGCDTMKWCARSFKFNGNNDRTNKKLKYYKF